MFLGPDGLRAGWGFAFYVAMFYLLRVCGQPVGLGRWSWAASGLWSMMLEEFGYASGGGWLPALLLGRVEGRAWGAYGLPGRQAFGKLFWVGAVWGFASITLLLAAMYGLRVFEWDIWRCMGRGL